MTKSNQYILNHWEQYNIFQNQEEAKRFLLLCEYYDTSIDELHNDTLGCYESFGFVAIDGIPTEREVINAILDHTTFSTEPREVFVEHIAREAFCIEDENEVKEEVEHLLENKSGDCDFFTADGYTVYRVYC